MVNVKYAHEYWTDLGFTLREGDADILLSRKEMEEFRYREDMPGSNRYVKLVKGIIDKINHGSDILIERINFGEHESKIFREVFETKMNFIDSRTYTLQDHILQDANVHNYRLTSCNTKDLIDIKRVEVIDSRPDLEEIVEESLPRVPDELRRKYVLDYGDEEADIYLNRDFSNTFRIFD